MTAAAVRILSSTAGLGATMAALYSSRFHLIPLGGEDGKKPLLRSWHESKRLPLAVVEDRMRRAGSLTYGVRLDGLMVVDLDTDNDATREYFAKRFNPSRIVVATGRGSHHYYRYHADARPRQALILPSASLRWAFLFGGCSLRLEPVDSGWSRLADRR